MPTSRASKLWTYGGIIGCLLLALLLWLFVVSPEFGGVSSANSQAAQATSQNAVLQAKIAKLRKESDNTSALAAALKAARQALPVDTGLPDLIRQLSSQTKQAGTTLISITVSTPTVVSGSGAASTTTAAPAVPAAGVPAATAAGQLFVIPLTLKTTGSIPAQDQLLTLIQTVGPRRALVTSADFQPGTGANTASITSDASMTIQLQIFVAPQTPAAVAELQKQLASAPGH